MSYRPSQGVVMREWKAEGETASVLYWNVTYKPAAEAERQKVYADLETYCGLDTEGMRLIVDRLRSL